MLNNRLIFLTVLMLIFFTFSSSFHLLVTGQSEADARTAIADAESLVLMCYEATSNAERSGANITQLLNILNDAGALLSKAHLYYAAGNFTAAMYFANQTRTKLDGFVNLAQAVGETGLQQSRWDFIVNVAGPVIGAVVIFGGFSVWFFLKKRFGSATT